MRQWRKLFISLGIVILLVVLVYFFRIPILRGVGNMLICEDPVDTVQAIFVLSGGPLDRGGEAIKLYKAGIAKNLVCTGGRTPVDFAALGITYTESEITRIYMERQGVPDSCIALIKGGNDTHEEGQLIMHYCKFQHLDNIMVVSSKFHTRRVCNSFRGLFRKAHIHLIIHGAPSSAYNEKTWWLNVDGWISVDDEYLKIIYYFFKY